MVKKLECHICFSKLEDDLCGIQKGSVIGVSGAPGVGKSRITRFMFIYNTIRYAIANKYPLKIIYFALEDNPKKIKTQMLSNIMYSEYRNRINSNIILSRTKNALSDKMFDKIIKTKDVAEEFFSYIDFVKECDTPNKIDNYLEKVLSSIW